MFRQAAQMCSADSHLLALLSLNRQFFHLLLLLDKMSPNGDLQRRVNVKVASGKGHWNRVNSFYSFPDLN
jgi:hypothetical protein